MCKKCRKLADSRHSRSAGAVGSMPRAAIIPNLCLAFSMSRVLGASGSEPQRRAAHVGRNWRRASSCMFFDNMPKSHKGLSSNCSSQQSHLRVWRFRQMPNSCFLAYSLHGSTASLCGDQCQSFEFEFLAPWFRQANVIITWAPLFQLESARIAIQLRPKSPPGTAPAQACGKARPALCSAVGCDEGLVKGNGWCIHWVESCR